MKRANNYGWRLLDCDGADSGDPSQRMLADIRLSVAGKHQPGGVVVPKDQLLAHAAEAWLTSRADLKARTRGECENLLSPKKRARKDANGNSTAHLSIIASDYLSKGRC